RLTIPERGDASRLRRETRLQRWLMNARELSCVAQIVFERSENKEGYSDTMAYATLRYRQALLPRNEQNIDFMLL
ncbi:hypothetical protein MEO41_28905, partial [Dolichospermum sp. ST_sed4]|nr:hypothetical protein [Dolichospermum sp. ST_sed4]